MEKSYQTMLTDYVQEHVLTTASLLQPAGEVDKTADSRINQHTLLLFLTDLTDVIQSIPVKKASLCSVKCGHLS